jgi:hypothetical protein
MYYSASKSSWTTIQTGRIRLLEGRKSGTSDELVHLIAANVGSQARIIHISPDLALLLSRVVGHAVNDVVLTPDEVKGLMVNLLISDRPPTGETRLSDWLEAHADSVGARYASELKRHYR